MILPLGYRYSSVYAGIRKDRRDDLALIVSDGPASAAGRRATPWWRLRSIRIGSSSRLLNPSAMMSAPTVGRKIIAESNIAEVMGCPNSLGASRT